MEPESEHMAQSRNEDADVVKRPVLFLYVYAPSNCCTVCSKYPSLKAIGSGTTESISLVA
jgi:hypothetical protein